MMVPLYQHKNIQYLPQVVDYVLSIQGYSIGVQLLQYDELPDVHLRIKRKTEHISKEKKSRIFSYKILEYIVLNCIIKQKKVNKKPHFWSCKYNIWWVI